MARPMVIRYARGRQITVAAMKETMKAEADPNKERDHPSPVDCCDFGYVLLGTGAQLRRNDTSESRPRRRSGQDGEFDPAEQWGKA